MPLGTTRDSRVTREFPRVCARPPSRWPCGRIEMRKRESRVATTVETLADVACEEGILRYLAARLASGVIKCVMIIIITAPRESLCYLISRITGFSGALIARRIKGSTKYPGIVMRIKVLVKLKAATRIARFTRVV